jgi:FkbM family methyltransferase
MEMYMVQEVEGRFKRLTICLKKAKMFHWTLLQTFFEVISIVFKYASLFIEDKSFKKKYLQSMSFENDNTYEKLKYFNFAGAKLPDITSDRVEYATLRYVFQDSFLIPCLYNDDYEKKVVESLDKYMEEGPYGYKDGDFDVTVGEGDVVIDAGAWIGDFSAYAASKGSIVYAFEPVKKTFDILKKTVLLNDNKIYAVQKALGENECEIPIYINQNNSGANTVHRKDHFYSEIISVTTLDKFVAENDIKPTFIKADIEGAERDMLKGAKEALKLFAPKLAICTYHLEDDPEVLEKIILDINPKYKIVHLRHKLFACVI